ncbi:MAG TPA: right-handed parallel beta-helix repeat-containing protein, partial [Dehalococcoidia bacterium]|nr:right-handed parallel beta-helix repeat-containing protein [Dehalococcoidia bacterium]
IWAIAASNDVISGNIVKNIASGGGIDAAGNNITITKNTITNPHTFGISYHCPASCANGTIANNTVSGAGGTGIAAEITGSGVFKVTGNTVSSSIADGALLVLNNGLISGNTLLKNGPGYAGFAGMHVQGNHNTITSNTFKNNGDDGLQAQGNSNSIVGNTATLNALDGIEVEASSSGNVLQGNAVTQNMGVGIEILAGAPSPDVLRKNTASGNLARACATADPGYVTLGTGTNANSFTSCGAGVGPETAVTHNVPAAPAQASAQPSRPVRPARPRRPLQSPRGS